jgi:4-amino-4-deoxy-L-arabinose transferase-like glycosyltransferase
MTSRARFATDLGPIAVAAGSVLLLRIAYMATISPYELTADEAQYWDWSRRFELSYYSKGPGVMWLLAVTRAVLGDAAWALRAPAALSLSLTAVVLAALAADMATPGRRRADAWWAFVLFLAVPAYQLTALLITIDAPYVACWAVASWAGWKIVRPEARRSSVIWMVLAFAVGAGFLFKYTIVLLVPGLLGFAWTRRRELAWTGRDLAHATAALLLLLACVGPVIVWNATHAWAAARHVLGFAGLPGGDRVVSEPATYAPVWMAAYIAGQFGAIGPALAAVMMAAASVWRADGSSTHRADAYLVWCAAPMLLFFLLVSVRTEVEGNWPLAAFTTLVVLAVRHTRFRPLTDVVTASSTTDHHRSTRSNATSNGTRWRRAALAYGMLAAVGLHFPLMVAGLPLVGRFVPVHRFQGFAPFARQVGSALRELQQHGTEAIPVIAATHNDAGRLAYYLPGRPRVASAGRFFAGRPSSYDFLRDVDLSRSIRTGSPVCLVGGTARRWDAAFVLHGLRSLSGHDGVFTADGYFGPRASAGADTPPAGSIE